MAQTHGTRYNIHVDGDGLLFAGQPGLQLTWMDAKVGDWVVTPRIGKPVEIQALWFNALRIMQASSRASLATWPATQILGAHLATWKRNTASTRQFWNEERRAVFTM